MKMKIFGLISLIVTLASTTQAENCLYGGAEKYVCTIEPCSTIKVGCTAQDGKTLISGHVRDDEKVKSVVVRLVKPDAEPPNLIDFPAMTVPGAKAIDFAHKYDGDLVKLLKDRWNLNFIKLLPGERLIVEELNFTESSVKIFRDVDAKIQIDRSPTNLNSVIDGLIKRQKAPAAQENSSGSAQ